MQYVEKKVKTDERLKKFCVNAVIQFEIGATDKKHAWKIANEAIYYGPKCFGYDDIMVIEGDEDWGSDDPFSEVGTVEVRDGSFEKYWKEEENDKGEN